MAPDRSPSCDWVGMALQRALCTWRGTAECFGGNRVSRDTWELCHAGFAPIGRAPLVGVHHPRRA